MKKITIRDLRQCWPETEKTLQVENELIITRDGQPVAKLVRVVPKKRKTQTLGPQGAHALDEKGVGQQGFSEF